MQTEYEHDEHRLKPIEDAIRNAGTPYSSEPSAQYWANLRVRIMDEVDIREAKKSVFVSVWSWITERPIVSGAIGLSVAAIVAALVIIAPQDHPHDVAALKPMPAQHHDSMPAVTTPHPTVKQPSFDRQLNRQLAKSDSAVEHLMQSPAYAQSIDRSVRESKHHAMAEARTNTEDIHLEPATSASVLSAQDEDIPVSLNELSESELKNVLHSLESRK